MDGHPGLCRNAVFANEAGGNLVSRCSGGTFWRLKPSNLRRNLPNLPCLSVLKWCGEALLYTGSARDLLVFLRSSGHFS